MVSFFKYRQCLITAPGVRTRIYAFGAPAFCLRVRCTNHCLLLATQSIEARAQQEEYRQACMIGLSINKDTKLEKEVVVPKEARISKEAGRST